jgi:hypothetical protein
MKSVSSLLLIACVSSGCSLYHNKIPLDLGGVSDGGDQGTPADMQPDLPPMCSDDSACPAALPVCAPAGQCVACQLGSNAPCATHHAATPLCGPSGACVECLSKDDCAAKNQTCNLSSNACAPCQAHADCSSGVCKPGGSCASTAEVLYVNNNPGAGCQPGGPGTRATPFCEVQAAALAALAATKPFVLVAGSPTPYGAVSLSSGTLSLIGPGKAASPPAAVTPSAASTPALLLSTTSGTATVTVEGLTLTGTGGALPGPGVRCQVGVGAATLTVRDSKIHMSGGPGVDSNGCSITLDRNTIGPSNSGGGLVLGGSTSYTVTNNIIAGNGTGAPAVDIANMATGTFAFNTVANNGGAGTGSPPGGFSCGLGASKAIQHSIVVGNRLSMVGGTQFAGNCTLMNVVTGTDSFAGATMLSPDLDATFRLTSAAANDACCIDKVPNPSTPNAAHDVDGNTRPKGAAHDIGAHEAR